MMDKVVLESLPLISDDCSGRDSSSSLPLSLSDRQQQKHGGGGDTGVRDGRLLQRS